MKAVLFFLGFSLFTNSLLLGQKKELAVEYQVLDYFITSIIPELDIPKEQLYFNKRLSSTSTTFLVLYELEKDPHFIQLHEAALEKQLYSSDKKLKIKKKWRDLPYYPKNTEGDFYSKKKKLEPAHLVTCSQTLYHDNQYYCLVFISPNLYFHPDKKFNCYVVVLDENLNPVNYFPYYDPTLSGKQV